MKDFFSNLIGKLWWLIVFIFMVGPMSMILAYFGINFFISSLISIAYYYFLKDIPFVKSIVFIISCILVFIDFPLKFFIGYICFFIVLGLLVYSPWIVVIINMLFSKKDKD